MPTETVYFLGSDHTFKSSILAVSQGSNYGSSTKYDRSGLGETLGAWGGVTNYNTNKTYQFYVYATVSDIASSLSISASQITKLKVYGTACTAYSNTVSPILQPLHGQVPTYSSASIYAAVGNSSGSSTTIQNTGDSASVSTEFTSFSPSDFVKCYGEYTSDGSGGGSWGYTYGIDITDFYVEVTYTSCFPTITSAKIRNDPSSGWSDFKDYTVSVTTNTGYVYLNCSSSSTCGTPTEEIKCYKYDDYSQSVTVVRDSTGKVLIPYSKAKLYFISKVTVGSTTYESSRDCTVIVNLPYGASATAYCSAIKVYLTGSESQLPSGYSVRTYYGDSESPTTNESTTDSDYSHTYTGLTPETDYYYRLKVVYATSGSSYNVIKDIGNSSNKISTLEPSISLVVTDESQSTYTGSHTEPIVMDKPQKLTLSSTSSCNQTPVYEYSPDGATWTTITADVTTGKYYYNLVKPYDGVTYNNTSYLRVSIQVNNVYYRSQQIWRLNPPTITPQYYIDANSPYDVDSTSIDVFQTPSGTNLCYKLKSTWDDNTLVTPTYHYEITNGGSTTTVITPVLSTAIVSGTYEIDESYIIYKSDAVTTVYTTDDYTLTINTLTFDPTNGQINVSSRNNPTIDIRHTQLSSISTVSGETMSVWASGWGTPSLTLTLTGYQAISGSSNWSPSATENIRFTVVSSSRYSVQPINTSYDYSFSIIVDAADSVGQTRRHTQDIRTPRFTCAIGIVPIVTYLPQPAVGSTDTEFSADASDSYIMVQQQPTISYAWHIYSDSTLTTEITNDSTKVRKISATTTADTFNFNILITGVFYLTVDLSATYQGQSLSSTWGDNLDGKTIIKEIVDTGITDYHRFCLVIKKNNKVFVASREHTPYLTNLKFGKYLANIGTLTCTITGLDRVAMDDNTKIDDIFDEPNAEVCLLDRMNPVWIGIVTEATQVETNYYNQTTQIKQYNITCYESQKSLAIDYIPNNTKGLISGTLSQISKKIIPTANQGLIADSDVNYSISLSNTSRLTALDQLYSQAGWRYRCRPNTIAFWNESQVAIQPYTISSILEDKELKVGSIAVFYKDESYGCGIVDTVDDDEITISKSFRLPTTGNARISIYDSFLIDFKPSYYQTANTREWIVNYNATNVNDAKNIRDKFGSVVVYGVGYSGETIASMMRAWMKINPDYTIDNAMRITKSYDSEIDNVVKLDEVTDTNGNVYSRYTITFNGWSFPDYATITRFTNNNIFPTIYFVSSQKNLWNMTVTYPSTLTALDNNPRRYYDQANNKKTAYVIAVRKDEYVGVSGDRTLKTAVVESLVQLSNVIFPIFSVDKPSLVPANDSSICVGDMKCTVVSSDPLYSEVKVSYITEDWQNTGIPHGHLTDVLVMDNSQTINYNNPDSESPYVKYPNVSLTTQGPEGYSIMEMERLACRYMQYGSNYNSQGNCNITVPFFYRNDYEIGCARLPMVGDRIALKKNEGTVNESISTYELQRYEFDMENYSVQIVFGMPILNIGEVIYNLLANSGMSIIPADSSQE